MGEGMEKKCAWKMSNDRQSRGGGFARTAINCTASGSWHRLFIESLPNRCSIQSVRNPRSLSAYVLYYVSKGKERPYQISPGVRWMHGRVDNEYIREIECRTWRNYASYLSSIGVGIGWNRVVFLVWIQNGFALLSRDSHVYIVHPIFPIEFLGKATRVYQF